MKYDIFCADAGKVLPGMAEENRLQMEEMGGIVLSSQVRKINRDLVIGWLIIVAVLFVSYCGEVIKGERTVAYLSVFMLATALPAFFCWYLYRKKPDRFELRYYIVAGYFIMYLFSMLTGSTSMVFSYILPLLSFLVLYHQPKLILATGIASFIVNIISIIHKFSSGEMTLASSKDGEIQLALLFLCFGGSYVATRLYDEITDENIAYMKMLDEKNIQIQKMTLQTITTIANTIDAKDEYTKGHSKRVSEYSAAIARELGCSEKEIQDISSIALLHDIGKIGVPDNVLNKPGKLTQEEYQLMKQHTVIGAEILKDIDMLPGIDIGAKYHHERYDGKGYPDGLKGEEIPFIARIIAVADAYDAMTSNRVYRKHLDEAKVMTELKNGIGNQFDPQAARALIRLLEEKRLQNISPDTDDSEMDGVSRILSRVMELREEQFAEKRIMDELTGVYNRSYGERLLQEAAEQEKGCFMLFDLDHFRAVNDHSGFVTGDAFLKIVTSCIKHISPNVLISRFGGDDFAAFSSDITTEEAAMEAMDRFMEEIRSKAEEHSESETLSVSAGAVLLEQGGKAFDELLLKADKALYVAKTQGGSQYFLYRSAAPEEEKKLSHADLNKLLRLIKNKGYYEGAFQISYSEFRRIYEFINKVADRNEQRIQILLFTVLPNDEDKVSVEERERVMGLLEQAIILSVRGVDVTTKYSSTQRIVLLMNLNEEQIHIVTDRIMKEFFKLYDKKEISVYYDIADLNI